MNDLCVSDHGDDDRRAADGLRLCNSCRRALERLIRGLPERFAQLEECLAAGSGGGGMRVSGSSSAPLPINTAAADHRDQIRHDLVWWCIYVSDARGLSLTCDSEPRTLAPWLAKHADWLSADPAAAEECLPVMRGLNGRAWALIDPDGRKRIKVGTCRALVDSEQCAGTLFATVRAEDDSRPSCIYCDTCDLEKPSIEWLRFSREYTRKMSA